MARDLIDRTDPHSPGYEARWADLLDRVEVTDESRVEIRLNHARSRRAPGCWGRSARPTPSIDGRVATSSQDRPLVSDGPYRCVAAARRSSRAATARTTANRAGRRSRNIRLTVGRPSESRQIRYGPAGERCSRTQGGRIKRIREMRLPRASRPSGP